MQENLSDPAVFREALAAEAKLAAMELASEYADLREAEACPRLRAHFAAQYRRMIGVDPTKRDDLAVALRGIRDGGRRSVDEVLAELTRTGPPPPSASAQRREPPAP